MAKVNWPFQFILSSGERGLAIGGFWVTIRLAVRVGMCGPRPSGVIATSYPAALTFESEPELAGDLQVFRRHSKVEALISSVVVLGRELPLDPRAFLEEFPQPPRVRSQRR
jgi:hypothetical protein